jgi:hypothetical protein
MASLDAGRRLADRYVLEERLGDGGHAEVWCARDERTGSRVALKFLHLGACGIDEALPVLRHEARMARFLEHPGVLRIEEPVLDGHVAFLPMEYAVGGNAARLRGASWRRIVPVLIEVARVLEHAHSRGVVHRDIKPGNVLFDAEGHVRVADFGTSTETGSCDAPANGSPFSASPQQLGGEPACPADDVYGLGALAYELLTCYPPFYPHFDARRVQEQDPPRPVPALPAPVALLDLVQTMLARKVADRPPLAKVIEELQRCLEVAGLPEEGGIVVEAAGGRATRGEGAARGRQAVWWGLVAAGITGLGVLLMLPGPAPEVTPDAVAGEPRMPIAVADALVEDPPAGGTAVVGEADAAANPPPASVRQPSPSAVLTLEDELEAGQQALEELKPAEATAAFRRALVIDADNAEARKGLAAAVRLQERLVRLADGTRAEAAGDLDTARAIYQDLLAAQPDFAPARNALARIDERIRAAAFEQHVAAGAEALRTGDVAAAEAAYARAAMLRADDARVIEGRRRIAEIQHNRQNAADLATGTGLEAAERWEEAVAHYRAVLERDADLLFAQEGLLRSQRRLELDRELADYQARPERLLAPAVRQAAQRALARGSATDGLEAAPRLRAQLEWLRDYLAKLSEPVRVELISDNNTEVRVIQLGELGRFESRQLNLPPGQYTVIGQREGFRDVRLELTIAPGQRTAALAVRCTERI